MKTKDKIIFDMCMTYRHDFGLNKDPEQPLSAGMTADERDFLVRSMTQIFENDIEWMHRELETIHSGERLLLPKSRSHALDMIRVAQFYLDTHQDQE